MKRLLIFLLTACMIALSACGKTEPEIIKTADMLNITNEEADYLGCLDRYEAVISAIISKTAVLENAHNEKLKIEAEAEYFFEDEYILTSFEPFSLKYLYLTESFNNSMDSKQAAEIYQNVSRNMTVEYGAKDNNIYILRFVSEELVEEYSAEYNSEFDSFRYIFKTETPEEIETTEFLEFIKLKNGAYAIQSRKARCYVSFGEKGEIYAFSCAVLAGGEYTSDESIFPQNEMLNSDWVTERGKNAFISIHTYENGILTHSECSSGPWKTVKITEADYSSAFYIK